MNAIMPWPRWFNPNHWGKQKRSWLAQLNNDVQASLPSEWMPFSDLTACDKCSASYNLYRRQTDFYPPSDIEEIKARVLSRIQAHHPHHPNEIEGVFFMYQQRAKERV